MKHTNKGGVVLISGVTKGLGAAMARRFAADGWRVAGFGRDGDAIARLGEALNGKGHFLDQADIRRSDDLDRFFRELRGARVVPDLVINNAGLINRNAPLWEVPEDEFAALLDVNIAGVHRILRRAVPLLIERGHGICVNMSSGWGRSTSPDVAPYCASKWAVEGLSRALAQELPEGVACASLNPGVIHTPMLESAFGKSGAARCPTPDEWAERAVPFLQSLDATANGQALSVPG